MGNSIVDIRNMGDALRNTGYKNIESAVSEIIDNSIEAEAKNVFVLLSEGVSRSSGRKVVNEIAFLDDGYGMSEDILGMCLGIGSSTRRDRKGMGRFGVGLPQASLYACPEIVVYSWDNGVQNARMVYLDIDKIKSGEQTEIEDPVLAPIPVPYKRLINLRTRKEQFDFSQHGTLVIWKKCDHLDPKTRGPLVNRLEQSIGQKFRYYIHDNKTKIRIVSFENLENSVDVKPNDPMFLMEDNRILMHTDNVNRCFSPGERDGLEPAFELYKSKNGGVGEVEVPIYYLDKEGNKKQSKVVVRFSIVKSKFYDESAFPKGTNPGNSELGKAAAKLTGVSVVRAGREIDFREFDFYSSVNEPQHRWWGCEILFNPELDEAFGVSNNKQYVELRRVDPNDLDDESDVTPLWDQLSQLIISTIREMYDHNETVRRNTRPGPTKKTVDPSVEIINTVEKQDEDQDEDEQDNIDVDAAKKEMSILGYEDVSDEEATVWAKNKVNIIYTDNGERGPAFDYKSSFGSTIVIINISHKFYKFFLNKIYENPEVKVTFELFLSSLFKTVDYYDKYQKDENDNLLTYWYNKLNSYINEQLNPKSK